MRDMKYKIALCNRQMLVLGKTQSDLSRETGISRITINRFFNRRTVASGTAKQIVEKGLGLKMKDVVVARPTATEQA